MSENERRQNDPRIDEIHTDIKSILSSISTLCVDVAVTKEKTEKNTEDLKEHKANHWQQAGIVIAIAGVLATILAIFIPYMVHAR